MDMFRVSAEITLRRLSAAALTLLLMLGVSASVFADGADAKRLLKAMSDYLTAQQSISFEYDAPSKLSPERSKNLLW